MAKSLTLKYDELENLKRCIKLTKIYELETDLKVY